jgi:RNA polymerase sigma-70 factor (ECF subfamily)
MHNSFSDNDEADLVARIRRSDQSAFEELFYAYALPLTKLAYHYVRSTDIADDIVQDAFVILWNEIGRNSFADRPFVFLQMIIRRRSIDELRRQQIEDVWQSSFEAIDESPATALSIVDALTQVEHGELGRLIAEAVATLPPRTRAVATLRWYERVSRTEAAEILGLSAKTIDAQLAKAARRVREYLECRGVSNRE